LECEAIAPGQKFAPQCSTLLVELIANPVPEAEERIKERRRFPKTWADMKTKKKIPKNRC
jgi:hypothetical protein